MTEETPNIILETTNVSNIAATPSEQPENPFKSRFYGLQWAKYIEKESYYSAIIAGCGTIGSWLSVFLARTGLNIHVIDFDKVEAVNMAGQFFPTSSIGKHKVIVIEQLVKALGTGDISTSVMPIEKLEDRISTKFYFSCLDSMSARKSFIETWKRLADADSIFIDGRLSAESGMVYFVTTSTVDRYIKEELCEDSEVIPTPCSAKATTHAGGLIASIMTSGFVNFINNQCVERKDPLKSRVVPFKIEFELPLLNFKTYE